MSLYLFINMPWTAQSNNQSEEMRSLNNQPEDLKPCHVYDILYNVRTPEAVEKRQKELPDIYKKSWEL